MRFHNWYTVELPPLSVHERSSCDGRKWALSRRLLASLLVAGIASGHAVSQLQVVPSPCGGGAFDRYMDRMVDTHSGSTWLFDGSAWQQIVSPLVPPAAHYLVYDEGRRRVMAMELNTWEWDGSRWRLSGPPPFAWWNGLFAPQFCYHAGRRKIVVIGPFGGTTGISLSEWDGSTWSVIPTTNAPPVRPSVFGWYSYHALAFDGRSGKLILFGRTEYLNAGNIVARLPLSWEWDEASGWTALGLGNATGAQTKMWFDEHRGQVMRHESFTAAPFSTISVRNAGGTWSSVAYTPNPGAAFSGRGGYDPVRGRFYDGFSGSAYYFTDLHPADYSVHAIGCSATMTPRIRLTKTWTRPWIGDTLSVDVNPCPQSFAVLATGFSDQASGATPLPIDLAGLGMPGCQLRVALDHLSVGTGAAGTVSFQIPVPNDPSLVGVAFWQQAFALAPGVNPAGALLSDSMRGRIGKSH